MTAERELIAKEYFHVRNGGYTYRIERAPNKSGIGEEAWIYFLVCEFHHHGWPASTGETVIPSEKALKWISMHLLSTKMQGQLAYSTDYGDYPCTLESN